MQPVPLPLDPSVGARLASITTATLPTAPFAHRLARRDARAGLP